MALSPAAVSPLRAQELASGTPLAAIVASLWACTAANGGRECGRVVWGDGTVSDVLAIGTAGRVAWPWAVAVAAQVPGGRVTLHHTHPDGSGLSELDRAVASLPGIARVCAWLPDGRGECAGAR